MSSPPTAGVVPGTPYTYSIVTSDPDEGETAQLIISAITKPAWLTFVDNQDGTALLSGTPTVSDIGIDNSVILEVVDPGGLGNTQAFVLNVTNAATPPTFISTPITSATESVEYRYSVRATDAEGDVITITATNLPSWLTLTDRGGGFAMLSGMPTGNDVGDHAVVLQATEEASAAGLATSQQFTITVASSGNGPTLTVNGDGQMNIFVGWNFADPGATATDLEDGNLTDQIQTTGQVNTGDPGVYVLNYSVSDSAGNRTQAQRIVRVVMPPEVGGIGSAGLFWLFSLLFGVGLTRLSR